MADVTTTTNKKPNAADYEPIPDVEHGNGNGTVDTMTNDYSGFDPQQVELLSTLDETIKSNGSFQFSLPTVNSDDMITQGQSMIQSMVMPTVTTVVAAITAFGLSAIQQVTESSTGIDHTISTISILIFPYINAIIVFMASFRPIESRCMTSVAPIFPKMDTIPETIQSTMSDISTNVDKTIDTIDAKVKEAMEPVLPTLQAATQYESMIRSVQPDVDIPDATDIDQEISETRTILTKPLQEATTKLTNDTTTTVRPYPLQSPTKFYWTIVVPIAIVCLATQLGIVYYATSGDAFTKMKSNVNATTSVGPVSSWTGDVASQLRGSYHDVVATIPSNGVAVDTSDPQPRINIFDGTSSIASFSSAVEDDDSPLESVANMTTDTFTATKEEIWTQNEKTVNEINSTLTNMNAQLNKYEVEFQDQVHNVENEMKDFERSIDTEVSNAIGPAESMIKSVLISYLISLLQLGLVYVMTSPKVKAFILNLVMQRASRQVDDTLRSTGVPDAMDDIFNVRFVRLRTKLMQLFTSVRKLNTYLEQLGLSSSDGGSGRNPVAALADTAKSFTSRFGFRK